ncbi:hypothetical protein B0T16DRAFT_462686 [Cercophora newfieldiana]|uniref:Uncharacterized protein n=1 Tax=Cercophora newfieldiana TaxID=92897 RepID=A0AA39XRN2_9PEZI|nr:hypothetical protein B0T16DRAFT_462686 [Cercophora newfieldiana]
MMHLPTLLATVLTAATTVYADSLDIIITNLDNGYPPSGISRTGFWNTNNDGATFNVNVEGGCRNPSVPSANEFYPKVFFAAALSVGSTVCYAALWRLHRPLSVPAGHVEKRATSSDPSCPEGFVCEADRQQCPVETVCAQGSVCTNFGGALACAPVIADLSWCALHPDTFEAVTCPNGGRCCHGQCHLSDSVCCDNPSTRCSLGDLCNACAATQTCGPSARCLDPSATSSFISTELSTSFLGAISSTPLPLVSSVLSSPSAPSSLSPPPSSSSPSSIPESTTVPPSSSAASTPATSVSASPSPDPTGTVDLRELLGLINELTHDYLDLSAAAGVIVKQLDVLAIEPEEGEEGLQKRGLTRRAAESTAIELRSLATDGQTLVRRAGAIQQTIERIPLQNSHVRRHPTELRRT